MRRHFVCVFPLSLSLFFSLFIRLYLGCHFLVRPQVSVPHTELDVVLGEEATFECQASGDPAPKLVWRRLDEASGGGGSSSGQGAPLPAKTDDTNRSIFKVD